MVAQIAHALLPILAAVACIRAHFCGPFTTDLEVYTLVSDTASAGESTECKGVCWRPSASCQGSLLSEVKALSRCSGGDQLQGSWTLELCYGNVVYPAYLRASDESKSS